MKKLTSDFFAQDPTTVAEKLIGMYLIYNQMELQINEVEAYLDENDSASHARHGKTKRSQLMFQDPGILYIYLIYGMYDMLNIVCSKKDHPGAILIRGAGEYDGPGKLTRGLGITRALNGKHIGEESGVYIEERGEKLKYIRTPRIGIQYADKKDKEALLRFKAQNRP